MLARRRALWLACTLALVAQLALAAEKAPDPAAEIAQLERTRDKRPRDPDAHLQLGVAYYRYARGAFDQGDTTTYESYLEKATREWVESTRLQPESETPHFWMGVASAYQGRIDDALQSFLIARKLAPGAPNAYTNIAETMIYAGRPTREVETWLDRGERMGAQPAVVELNYCLLKWRDGRPDFAARSFTKALKYDRSVVESWNEAPVSRPIHTFEDLKAYCCSSPACGPYLTDACKASQFEVTRRELPEEVARRELLIEMEKRRELNKIYEGRKDLQIEVAKPEATPDATTPPAAKPSPATPAPETPKAP